MCKVLTVRGQFTCKYRVRVARVWTWSSSSVTWAPAAAALEDGTTHCSRRLPRPSLSVDRTDLSNRTRTVARARSAGVSTVRAASPGDWAPVDQRKRDARPGNPARLTPPNGPIERAPTRPPLVVPHTDTRGGSCGGGGGGGGEGDGGGGGGGGDGGGGGGCGATRPVRA